MNEDLSRLVGKIMASPGFGELVSELKQSGIGAESPAQGTGSTADGAASQGTPTPEEITARLPSIMAALGSPGNSVKSIDGGAIDKAVRAIQKMDSGNCEKLLCALKPYLNKGRGEVIDKAVSVMKITDLLGAMGDLPGTPKSESQS